MKPNIKEYTQDEFNKMVEAHDLEVFSAESVTKFCKDTLEKSESNEIDEFEKSCAAADFASLTSVVVVGNDLIKRTVYYREAQTEAVEVPEGIFKSINDKMCRKFKETPLNIMKGIAGINCADEDAIEKAKALPIGTEKTYGGKLYVKTEKGWRPKRKSNDGGKEMKTDKEAQEKKFIENIVAAAKDHGMKSVQFQTAMLAPKNAYKDDAQMNRFLVKLGAALLNSEGEDTNKDDSSKQEKKSEKAPSQSIVYGKDATMAKLTLQTSKGKDDPDYPTYRIITHDKKGAPKGTAYVKGLQEAKAKAKEMLDGAGLKPTEATDKKGKFAKEIEEARKVGEQLQKEHESRKDVGTTDKDIEKLGYEKTADGGYKKTDNEMTSDDKKRLYNLFDNEMSGLNDKQVERLYKHVFGEKPESNRGVRDKIMEHVKTINNHDKLNKLFNRMSELRKTKIR